MTTMVAGTSNVASRFFPPPDPLVAGRWRLVRLTRHDAQAMVRIGIIPEDASTELLNGWVVLKDRSAREQDPTMIGQDHRKCVERLSSLRKLIDTGEKLAGYAEAAVAQYVVVNLRNRTAEIYTKPDSAARTYPPPRIVGESESLELRVGEDELISVPMGDLLP